MSIGRDIMKEWVLEALESLGGEASILDMCKHVWEQHEQDMKASGDLLYEWQYGIRWAGSLLRKDGLIRPATLSP